MHFTIIKSIFDPKYKYVFLVSKVETIGGIHIINSVHKSEDEEKKPTEHYISLYQESHNKQCEQEVVKIMQEEVNEQETEGMVPAHDITEEAIRLIESTKN